MRKIYFYYIATVLFLCTNLYSQTGWVNYYTGVTTPIRGIYFINSNTGWFVTDTCAVYKTTNGGINWNRVLLVFYEQIGLSSIKFLNDSVGIAVGGHQIPAPYNGFYRDYIFRTTNGGNNWDTFYDAPGNSAFNDVYYNLSKTYVTGAGFSGDIGWWLTGGIYKSTDGGNNFSLGISKGESTSLSFINPNTGWVNAYYADDSGISCCYLFKTTNSGVNWILQLKDSIPFTQAMRINKLHCVNDSIGYAIAYKTGAKFLKTTNGGTNWVSNVFPNGQNNTMYFVDANTGWVGGSTSSDTSCISYTSDGGNNWLKQKRGYFGTVNCFHFINNMTGWAGMNNGEILRTVNGGITKVDLINVSIPSSFSLSQNYPNPFNPITNIKFSIVNAEIVKIVVYDIQGREVQTLVNELLKPGTYEVSFDGSRLNSGVYFYKLITNGYSETRKIILLK